MERTNAGDAVLYGKFDGMSIDYDGAQHVLIRDDDVLLTWQGGDMTEAAVQTVRDRYVIMRRYDLHNPTLDQHVTCMRGLTHSWFAVRLKNRILVKVKKAAEKSAGGILLAPTMGKQRYASSGAP